MPIALVTGAGVRVGRAIALALARAGYTVALHAHRSQGAAEELCASIGGSLHLADLTSSDEVARLAREVGERHGALDVLVNSAAAFERRAFVDVSVAEYRAMQALNLDAPFFLTQALAPLLAAGEGGLVVNITDVMAERAPAGFAHYAIGKAALVALTRALAVELAPAVRVNAVAPGTVLFPDEYGEGERAKLLRRIPLGRAGEPDDVARAVLFFAREAPFVTGQVLAVDGGRSVAP